MAVLKTDYVDDVLNTSVNTQRKYIQTNNADGTISLTDATSYTQEGSTFGAADINATNQEVNALTENLTIDGDYKFKVGKDGDGNVCYYGADGSLIPFKSDSDYAYITSLEKNVGQQYDTKYFNTTYTFDSDYDEVIVNAAIRGTGSSSKIESVNSDGGIKCFEKIENHLSFIQFKDIKSGDTVTINFSGTQGVCICIAQIFGKQ